MKSTLLTHSLWAQEVDSFALALTVLCIFIVLALTVITAYLCWKYHASKNKKKAQDIQSREVEILWTLLTTLIFLGIFAWATHLYKKQVTPASSVDYEIFVYAKRWMWKFYHPGGLVEVNDLHLPRGKRVRLTMISQDVIHSLFLPGFRVKQDVLPQAYTFLNLSPEIKGESALYCAEYCGTQHSGMTGRARVIEDQDYQKLIHTPGARPQSEELFIKHGCINCHHDGSDVAPDISEMSDHEPAFLRKSILEPLADVEKGKDPIMPSYKTVLSEEDIHHLIQLIKSKGHP